MSLPARSCSTAKLFRRTTYPFININSSHQQYNKQYQSCQSPQKTHTFFYGSQHHNGYEENSSHFVPEPQLLGTIPEQPLQLLFKNLMKGKMIDIQEYDKNQFYK